MRKKDKPQMVREAAVAYVATPRPEGPQHAATRLSAKNQVTLPVAMIRALGLKAGDEINLWLEKGQIVLERRLAGEELLDSLQGALKGGAWSTKEGADEWLRREREGWEREWHPGTS